MSYTQFVQQCSIIKCFPLLVVVNLLSSYRYNENLNLTYSRSFRSSMLFMAAQQLSSSYKSRLSWPRYTKSGWFWLEGATPPPFISSCPVTNGFSSGDFLSLTIFTNSIIHIATAAIPITMNTAK